MDSWNIEEADKESVFDALASVVKAMANGRRLELIELLAQGEHPVEALSRMSGMALTTTSSHLQTLRRTGLVKTRRAGTSVYYRLAGDDVAELYLAAKGVALQRYPELRETLVTYMDQAGAGAPTPLIGPAEITSEMTIVDVRPREEFEAGRFPGAISIPLEELEDRYREIPTGAEVVVYCRGEFCRMAREAARWLCERDVDAKAMDEGIVEWRASKRVDLEVA